MSATVHPLAPRPQALAGGPVVLARWVGRRGIGAPMVCDECGEDVEAGQRCPTCYQQAPTSRAGMLATVITTSRGERRAVIAQRTPAGGWAPVRTVPATGEVIRALRRQDTTTAPSDVAPAPAGVTVLADWRGERR